MSGVLDRLPDSARVAIVRLRSLGDCVLTTPAIEILRQSRPDLQIAVVVEDRFKAVFQGSDAIEALLPPSIPALRAWRPQLCLNLHGGTRSAALIAASGARFRAGFAHFRFSQAYNIRIPRAQQILAVDRVVHTAEHLAAAMFFLGARRVEIPRARLFTAKRAGGKPYAVIHPIASQPDKTWPADRFLAVAAQLGVEPVFIAGPGEDLSAFHPYRAIAGAPLAEIKDLLANASLFIGNDSGPAHMAAAFGLPVVVLFGSSNMDVWRPWKTPSEALSDPRGIAAISTARVLESLAGLRSETPRVHA
jgi:ADP-heptose:LPS heptosyltransferase